MYKCVCGGGDFINARSLLHLYVWINMLKYEHRLDTILIKSSVTVTYVI